MQLMLKAISNTGEEVNNIILKQESATIGRNANNTLVLEDPKKHISGQHAIVDFQNPDYFITDTSVNGILINNTTQRVGNGNTTKLNDGDKLYIGDYIVAVQIVHEQETKEGLDQSVNNDVFDYADDPFAELDKDSVQEMIDENQWKPSSDWKEKDSVPKSIDGTEFDIFDLGEKEDNYLSKVEQPLGFKEAFQPYVAEKKEQNKTAASDLFGDDWLTKEAEVQEVEEVQVQEQLDGTLIELESIETISGDPNISSDSTEIKQSIQKPIHPEKSLGEQHSSMTMDTSDIQASALIDNFIRGAGLIDTELNESLKPESFYIIGKILRLSIQGTMDVLMGRAKIKNEMHLDVTMIKSTENNPVKFSVSSEEAIRKLLAPQDAGYLSAEEAIDEAFDDIRAHQFSVIAGMQTALLDVLKRFDPQKLEQRFQHQSPFSSSIPIHKQAKLWDLFEHLYHDLEHEAADNFYHLFGQAFAESYDQQMLKLKKSKKESLL